MKPATRLLRWSWWALLAWQPAWHGLLPGPWGSQNVVLALAALVPLLVFTPGVLRAAPRVLFWTQFLVMLYFMIGVVEVWSNTPQRAAAAVQVALCLSYFGGLLWFSRRQA